MTEIKHIYEVRPRKDKRGIDLISDALPIGRLWYGEPDAVSNAIAYAKFYSRFHNRARRQGVFSQRRRPPRNAFSLVPMRQRSGRSANFLALPPPNTTSSR
jgi:hypothetical protein